jgi:hypothetical protein
VDVFGQIGVAVMVAVVRRPPENAFLRRGLPEERDRELRHAIEAVGTVAEVAVEAGGDREHPEVIGREAEGDAFPGESHEVHAGRRQVNDQKPDDRGDTISGADGLGHAILR